MSDPIQVMLVDDHPLVRRGLAELIADEPSLEVCQQVSTGEEALQTIEQASPDLLIVDLALPGISGMELIKRIRARDIEVHILVTSMHDESLFAERCLRAGANGYVNKEVATEKIIVAIHHILKGKTYLSPEMTNHLVDGAIHGHSGKDVFDNLTDRELEVFGLIGKGMTCREIAQQLHLSVKTVETHRDHIRTKLRLSNTTDLIRHAVQWVLENG